MNGEAQMIGASIAQAFRDACLIEPRPPKLGASLYPSPREAMEAWRFLTARNGEWAASREALCWAVGVDPDLIRCAALRKGPSRYVRSQMAA